MNIFAIIILATLAVDFILDLVADILNLRALHAVLPTEFKGVYDAQEYKKSQEYTRVNTRFGFIVSSFSLILTLIFWFSGGFPFLDDIVRSWGLASIWTGMLYIGILVLLKSIISLPFGIYSTFVIEERFGFNRTTVKTFILDILKGLALGILIGAPLLAGILAFFEFAGNMAWLYCWLVTVLFTLIIQYIAPTWIMPLFNKFEPIQEGDLKENILNYAKKVNYKLKEVVVMDGSRRSSKSNAFFTGFGKNKRIALFDTLIEKHTTPELVAVLAHEIGHYKLKHILKGMAVSIIHSGIVFFLLSFFIKEEGLFQAFYMTNSSIYAGLIFFGML